MKIFSILILGFSLLMLDFQGVPTAKGATCTIAINASSELAKMNTARPGDVVCAARGVRGGEANITASGTAASPIIYQFNGTTFTRFKILASNVVVDNIHVNMQGVYSTRLKNEFRGDNITLQNSLIENGGKALIYITDGDNLTIRDNVIRNAVKRPFSGSNCIAHQGGRSTGVRIIGNELRNCASDGLQITQNATAVYPRNVEIAHNDIYITPELYTNGGSTACAENALDFKGGSHVHVHHNAMWGFRKTDARCSGTGDAGYAINLHKLANNYLVESNNMFDIGSRYGCFRISRIDRVRAVTDRNNICRGANQGGPIAGIGRTVRPVAAFAPGAIQFSAASYAVSEVAGVATVTVSRTGGSTGPVSVSYTTTLGGTAIEGADYTFTSGVLTWADGDAAARTLSVPILDDTDVEATETVGLALGVLDGGATLGISNTSVVTIASDE